MEKNISENKIWHKIITKLNEAELKYVLVGAAALAIHGLPRATMDIDIYIISRQDILRKLFEIAESLKLKSEEKSLLSINNVPELLNGQWVCFSHKGCDILDVFLADEKEFNELYKNSKVKHDSSLSVRVASLEDIVNMKKACGRPTDLADLNLIEKYKKLT